MFYTGIKTQIVSLALASIAISTAITSSLPVCAQLVDCRYLLRGDGGRIDWSETNKLLAVDRINKDSFTRIWTMDKEGHGLKCIGCDNARLPQEHQGNPAWHPGGKYIVFQAADPKIASKVMAKSLLYKIYTSPGSGVNNNVWIMTADGQRVWQITKVVRGGGILHPHFSADGKKLVWAQRLNNEQGIGRWVIKLATFEESNGEPIVGNIETLKPGNLLWYETHGFSPDGNSIIFTGMPSHGLCADFDIYTYDLNSKALTCLTDPKLRQWDEHAHFTPDGKRIVWMSSMGSPQAPAKLNQITVKTDFWIMNADGTNKRQFSFFNDKWKQWMPKHKRVIASDLTISGDGSCIYGYIQDPGTVVSPGSVVRIEIPKE